MIERILVPLDGSQMAESVLPLALAAAKCTSSQIILLHIIEERPPRSVHGEPHLTNAPESHDYLGKLAERLFPKGGDEARIAEAYRLLYGRAPSKQEVDIGLQFLRTTPEKPGNNISGEPITAWKEYARVLLSANEFEFMD